MEDGQKQGKYTGYTPLIKAAKGSGSAPVEFTEPIKASPVLINAHTQDVSLSLGAALSASNILAVLVMMGDFRAAKTELPHSRQTSSNGKIYWCIESVGHNLSIENGKLLVDGIAAETLIENILAEK